MSNDDSEKRAVHPPHYGGDTVHEVWNCLEAWGLECDALLWNVVKYVARTLRKENTTDKLVDLKKARQYLLRRIKKIESAAREIRAEAFIPNANIPASTPGLRIETFVRCKNRAVGRTPDVPPLCSAHGSVHTELVRLRAPLDGLLQLPTPAEWLTDGLCCAYNVQSETVQSETK